MFQTRFLPLIQPVYSNLFYHHVSLANNPTELLVKTRFNNHPLHRFAIPETATANNIIIQVDLASQNEGDYLLLTDLDDAPVKSVYIDRQLNHAAAKGVVNIYLENAQDQISENGAKFTT